MGEPRKAARLFTATPQLLPSPAGYPFYPSRKRSTCDSSLAMVIQNYTLAFCSFQRYRFFVPKNDMRQTILFLHLRY
jgi:hypothetical protein